MCDKGMPPKFHGWMKVRIGNTNFHLFVFLRASNPFKDEQCLEHPNNFCGANCGPPQTAETDERDRWSLVLLILSYAPNRRCILLHDWASIIFFIEKKGWEDMSIESISLLEGRQLSIAVEQLQCLAIRTPLVFSMVSFPLFPFSTSTHIIVYSLLFCEHVNWNSSHRAKGRKLLDNLSNSLQLAEMILFLVAYST